MASSIAYVVLGNVQAQLGEFEEEGGVGLVVNVTYATVSPSNKPGVSGSVQVPFNYGDSAEEIYEAVNSLVIDAVRQKTDAAPRVRIIGEAQGADS